MSQAPPDSSSPPEPPQKRPLLFPSRIIVFSLLALGLVALGFDLPARFHQHRAFAALQPYVEEGEIGAGPGIEPCTPSRVKELLGVTPVSENRDSGELQQVFSWQGVFNRYHVQTQYGGVVLAAEDPKDAEPLLLSVSKSSTYIWEP